MKDMVAWLRFESRVRQRARRHLVGPMTPYHRRREDGEAQVDALDMLAWLWPYATAEEWRLIYRRAVLGESCEAIGRETGVSGERIRQRYDAIVTRLREAARKSLARTG